MTIYRQGDVLIRRVDSLPKGARDVTRQGRIVLALGEATGHAHAIAEGAAREFTFADATETVRRFLSVVSDKAEVRHEEHASIPLPSGIYEIILQREYSPGASHTVSD
jgi:hypothetical protein